MDVTFQGDLGRPGRAASGPARPPPPARPSETRPSPAPPTRPAPPPARAALRDGDGVVQKVFELLLERGLLRLQRWQDLPGRGLLARAAAGLHLGFQFPVFAVEAGVVVAGGQPQAWRRAGEKRSQTERARAPPPRPSGLRRCPAHRGGSSR